ncbi:FkbM family methyltransferase [Ruegeria sp. HKCCD7221]|uniref:FkbM family methyltransferase n=1 Tax=Ruegeria sp. HKCCD7221 TaxID=2683009 RepID=UPI001479E4E9|nr:FkbM family methyltransferase [Ruegeria sp. HKCCD7221]
MDLLDNFSDKLRTWNRRRIDRRRLTRPPQQTREGFLFNGADFQRDPDWDTVEREFLARTLPKFDVFLNVGAHYGFYCCLARHLNLPIIAFEPVNANFEMLMKNLTYNGFQDKATLIHAAAGPNPTVTEISGGFATATLRTNHRHPKTQKQAVPIVPIDVLSSSDLGKVLVLMDVEGFELEALRGATGLLSRVQQTAWIVEIFPSWVDERGHPQENEDYIQAIKLMRDFGYNTWLIGKDLRQISNDDISEIMTKEVSERPGGNFLFASLEVANKLIK